MPAWSGKAGVLMDENGSCSGGKGTKPLFTGQLTVQAGMQMDVEGKAMVHRQQ